MCVLYLCFICIFIMVVGCDCEANIECPKPVEIGSTAGLTCRDIDKGSASISHPPEAQVAYCINNKICTVNENLSRLNVRFIEKDMIGIEISEVDIVDEGFWKCKSGSSGTSCDLVVYELPTCEVNSDDSTKDLTLGDSVTLTFDLGNYYCSTFSKWILKVGNETEELDKSGYSIITKDVKASQSTNGSVDLMLLCDQEHLKVPCTGVKQVQLRDPPTCKIENDELKTAKIGNKVTVEAEIGEYPCEEIRYHLLIGNKNAAEFILKEDSLYAATFTYVDGYTLKDVHLKYTCNGVSAIGPAITEAFMPKEDKDIDDHPEYAALVILVVALACAAGILVVYGIIVSHKLFKKTPCREPPPAKV